MVSERELISKITWRLMPFLGILYLIAYIDRQNVSFAKLQMVGDLGMSEYAYGLGASLFFIGYFLFEVPSNLFLNKLGARIWFARILVSWGIVTIALAYTQNATMFYILRFLLGVCEAGLQTIVQPTASAAAASPVARRTVRRVARWVMSSLRTCGRTRGRRSAR